MGWGMEFPKKKGTLESGTPLDMFRGTCSGLAVGKLGRRPGRQGS